MLSSLLCSLFFFFFLLIDIDILPSTIESVSVLFASFRYARISRLKSAMLMDTETKNQWARDDPAFAVIQAFFVGVSEVVSSMLLSL